MLDGNTFSNIRLIWFRIETSGGLSWKRWWTLGFL